MLEASKLCYFLVFYKGLQQVHPTVWGRLVFPTSPSFMNAPQGLPSTSKSVHLIAHLQVVSRCWSNIGSHGIWGSTTNNRGVEMGSANQHFCIGSQSGFHDSHVSGTKLQSKVCIETSIKRSWKSKILHRAPELYRWLRFKCVYFQKSPAFGRFAKVPCLAMGDFDFWLSTWNGRRS